MPGKTSQQLVFDFPLRPALGREDFIVTRCNEAAVSAIDRWPEWPANMLALWGPKGAGKSHLAHVWRAKSNAKVVEAADLSVGDIPELFESSAFVIDDCDLITNEEAFFHLYNHLKQTGAYTLFVGTDQPGKWATLLSDLKSRLSTIPAFEMGSPDEDLLRAVLEKQFRDRQLEVDGEVLDFLLLRIERSFEEIRRIADAVDLTALTQKRRITKKLAVEAMEALGT